MNVLSRVAPEAVHAHQLNSQRIRRVCSKAVFCLVAVVTFAPFLQASPSINSISPTSGNVGTVVTINGLGFGSTQGSSTVTFNGAQATPTSWTATQIVVPVPTNGTSGTIVVTVNSAASNGAAFNVTPNIASLSPSSGLVGTSVTIAGSGFGAAQGGSTVVFNGVNATPTSWSATSIVVPVPTGATTGNITVTVNGIISNRFLFIVGTGPGISGISPTSGNSGTAVTISGRQFGSSQGSGRVRIGGIVASITSWSDTSIVAIVPPNLAPVGVNVVVSTTSDSNTVTFTVTNPKINSLSINAGPAGQTITVSGINFGASQGSSSITFNGVAGTPTSWSSTSITVPVPAGATTGNVVVTVSGNSSVGMPFMVTPPTPAPGLNFIQGNYLAPASPETTVTVAYPVAQVAGDLNVVVVGWRAAATIQAVTDTAGNTYALAVGPTAGTNRNQSIYYAKNIVGGASNSVLVQFSSAPQIPDIRIAEYSGLDTGAPLDVTVAGTGTSTACNSGSITTTNANDLLVGANTADGKTTTAGTGYTSRVITFYNDGSANVLEDRIVTSTGSYNATATLLASSAWVMQMVAFKRAPAPSISSISPTSGPVGTSVTITGANFGINQGQSSVTFNGVAGTPTSWSAMSIMVPVPNSATTGNIVVSVGGQASNGVAFTVTSPAPVISGISPTSGPVGTSVTIAGTNFGAAQGTSTVTFNGTAASPTSWSATSIVVPVPNGATTGSVIVTVGGFSSNGAAFTVVAPPSITSLSPAFGSVGTSVTISGSNFGSSQGSSTVTFNGRMATPTSWSVTSILASVPNGTTTGNVVVTVSGQASNGRSFTVTSPPSITASISPAPNTNGWNKANVTVTFTCTAGSSPIQSCASPVVVSSEGANQQIAGTVTDTAGQTATATATVNLDKTPPTVSVSTPADGSILSTAQVAVSGTIFDGLSGISSAACNGAQATISAGSFSCNVTLNPGMNPVTVQATDVAGNQGSASITASLVFGPKVIITSPAPLALFSANPITLSGTIDDPHATVSVNGIAGSVSGNTFTINGVALREAKNLLTVTAVNSAGGVGSDTVDVYLDTTPPSIHIDTPTDGAIVTSPTVTVTGMVNDLVNGTVNQGQVTVAVNGVAGLVSNRSFQATNIQLVPGDNLITAAATDIGGNVGQHQIHVKLQAIASQQRISILSGDGQTAPIGRLLSQPLVVQLTDSRGVPIPNRAVTFIVQRSDGILIASPDQGRQITLQSDASGRAAIQLQLGTRVGVGNNVVSVTAPGFVGEVLFSESSTIGLPASIHIVSGDMQKGQAGLPLPEPLVVIVTDAGGNPVSGVQVTYTVVTGGGSLGGAQTSSATTDTDGKAQTVLTLALQEGVNNNSVTADFAGDTSLGAAFTSSGIVGGVLTNTTVSGIVLDNANGAIPNATASIKGTNLSALTNAQGQFTIANAPVGNIVLYIDGSTSSRPETFPTLSFQMATVAGINNTLNGPIFLPPIDTTNSQVVGGNQDVILTMNGVPGVRYTVFANSAIFSDGSHVGRMTLSQVHADKVPMTPPNGSAPTLVGTLQPAGVTFNPPVKMELPNTDGLAPGTVVELFSFHHDVEQFVTEGTGRVSQDGSTIVSDPGFGLTVSGWHGSGPPIPSPPSCGSGCGACAQCVGNACQPRGPGSPFTLTATADNQPMTTTNSSAQDYHLVNDDVKFAASSGCSTATYDWDFGDGSPHGTGANVQHKYTQPGNFTASVQVSCSACQGASPPPAQITVTAVQLTLTSVSWTGNGQNQMMKTGNGAYNSGTYASDGNTQIVNPVWQSNNGTIITQDPVSYVRTTKPTVQAVFQVQPSLSSGVPAVLRILGSINQTDGDSVELDFNDTNFQLQGNSTQGPAVAATDSLSDSPAGDVELTMHWSISLDGGSTFIEVATNDQLAFVTWDFAHGYDTQARVSTNVGITAMRIQRSAAINAKQYDITSLATVTATSVNGYPGFAHGFNVDSTMGGLPWGIFDTGVGCDCYSLAELSSSILQMIGVTSAKAEKAYPTGYFPPGDTDTTTPEQDANGRPLLYEDGGANNYEGFFEVTDQGTREGYTVAPVALSLAPYPSTLMGDNLYFTMIRNTLSVARQSGGFEGRQYFWNPTGLDFTKEVPFPTLP